MSNEGRPTTIMKNQTWQQWARAQTKDPGSSKLRKGCLGALTGQDTRALSVFVSALQLYAVSDENGQHAALTAMRASLPAMQKSVHWIAQELIPFALEWHDRERLWPRIAGVSVEGEVDAETGAGIESLARKLVEKAGRAGMLPPSAQAEFDARRRS